MDGSSTYLIIRDWRRSYRLHVFYDPARVWYGNVLYCDVLSGLYMVSAGAMQYSAWEPACLLADQNLGRLMGKLVRRRDELSTEVQAGMDFNGLRMDGLPGGVWVWPGGGMIAYERSEFPRDPIITRSHG